jgi:transposase
MAPRKGTKGADSYDREKYKWRHLIESFFCRIKAFRRIATRYDKTYTCIGLKNSRISMAFSVQ